MAERCREVILDGQRRYILEPEKRKEYWLGYPGNFPNPESVSGIYWGYSQKRRPLFLDLTKEGRVKKYSSPTFKCFLTWFSDGEDGPEEPAIKVFFDGFMPEGPEKDNAAEIIRQIREAKQRELAASLARVFRR